MAVVAGTLQNRTEPIMPQSFSMRLFDRWLAENRTRFRHPPTAIVRRKGSRAFRFVGVAPSVWGHVCDWAASSSGGLSGRDLGSDRRSGHRPGAARDRRLRPVLRGRRPEQFIRPGRRSRSTRLRTLAGVVQRAFSGRPERDAFSDRGGAAHGSKLRRSDGAPAGTRAHVAAEYPLLCG